MKSLMEVYEKFGILINWKFNKNKFFKENAELRAPVRTKFQNGLKIQFFIILR